MMQNIRPSKTNTYSLAHTYDYNVKIYRSMGTTSFILIFSRQQPGPTKLDPARSIPDNMKELPDSTSFRNRFLRQRTFFANKETPTLILSMPYYKCKFDRTVQRTLQFNLVQYHSFDRLPATKTEPARMANVPLTKLLLKGIGQFRIALVTPNADSVEKN